MSFAYEHSPDWQEAYERDNEVKNNKSLKIKERPSQFERSNKPYAKFIKDNNESPYFTLTRALCQNQLRHFLANEDRAKTKIRRFFDSSFQNYFLGAILVEHQLSSKNGTVTTFGIPQAVLIELMKGSLSSKRRAISTAEADGYIYIRERTLHRNQKKVFATEATINDFVARAFEYHNVAAENGLRCSTNNWDKAHIAHAVLLETGKAKIEAFFNTFNFIGGVKNGK